MIFFPSFLSTIHSKNQQPFSKHSRSQTKFRHFEGECPSPDCALVCFCVVQLPYFRWHFDLWWRRRSVCYSYTIRWYQDDYFLYKSHTRRRAPTILWKSEKRRLWNLFCRDQDTVYYYHHLYLQENMEKSLKFTNNKSLV